MAINYVFLQGRLGKDPEIREFNGVKMATFPMAVDRDVKDKNGNLVTDWFSITTWRGLAEFAEKFLTKGSAVFVTGRLQQRIYEAQDGSRREVIDVLAERINFQQGNKDQNHSAPAATAPAPKQEFTEVEDDGLPF